MGLKCNDVIEKTEQIIHQLPSGFHIVNEYSSEEVDHDDKIY